MKDSVLTTKGWALLIVAAVLVAAGTINFAQRLTHKAPPTDGVDWVQTPRGLAASSVKADSPAGRKGVFGILPGDLLVAVSPDEKTDEQVVATYDVQSYLEEANVNAVTELSSLIAAQRAYEMNAKVVTAADQMLSSSTQMMRG